jgi:4'-phosphopantetheinyl transferase
MSEVWGTVSSVPLLPPGVIHLWRASVDALVARAPYFEGFLDQSEHERGDRFHAAADRLRHIIARGALRSMLGGYLDAAPESIAFGAGPFGKPHCTGDRDTPISFNISHSGDIVLLAFARVGDLGVDVERWNARLAERERTRIGDSVFTSAERAAIQQLSSAAERERGFYSLWSRKEAYLKGTGSGITAGLAHVEVSADATARLIEDARDTGAVHRWALRDIHVGAGYAAALAFTPPGQRVVMLAASPQLFSG